MSDIKNFIKFLDNCKNQYFVVAEMEKLAVEKGFKKILLSTKWDLKKGENYYIILDGSIFAFKIGRNLQKLNIVASHTDSPGLIVKPNPIIIENGYVKLNVDVYGGPILNTWFDKPLGIAGKVGIIGNDGKIEYRLFDTEDAVAIIPNLAIHQNRGVNDGISIGKQKDILPILGQFDGDFDKDYLNKIISKKLNIEMERILHYTLYTYMPKSTKITGINNEFISSPRLDNLAMAYSSLIALFNSKSENAISIVAAFDNEEVGSNTIYGADSKIFIKILERIANSIGITTEDFDILIANSTLISADMAHAIHPNFPEKTDPTNKLKINEGIAIKTAIGKYASSIESTTTFIKLCKDNSIPYQHFVNRSDAASGSTVGPSISANTCIATVDIGAPMLAMHSAIELMGAEDYKSLCKAFTAYYNL